MKRIIILTILLLFCFSGLVYAQDKKVGKKVHVKINYNDDGKITRVQKITKVEDKEKEFNHTDVEPEEVRSGQITIIGEPAQILLLPGDDPCIVQGGKMYCW